MKSPQKNLALPNRHAKAIVPKSGRYHGNLSGYLAEFLWRRYFEDEDVLTALMRSIAEVFDRELWTTPSNTNKN